MVLIALVGGVLGLIVSWALRRDTKRARSLRNSKGVADERFVLLLLPGISLFLLGAGLLGVIVPGIGGALGTVGGILLAIPCLAVLGLGIFCAGLGMGSGPVPTWAKPKWDR